jgi:hypothetical protein
MIGRFDAPSERPLYRQLPRSLREAVAGKAHCRGDAYDLVAELNVGA